jgi:hypothetical protein
MRNEFDRLRKTRCRKCETSHKDTRADDESCISAMQDKKRRCYKCRDQPYTVADAVRDFFLLRLLTLGGNCNRYAHDMPIYGLTARTRRANRLHAVLAAASVCLTALT